MSETSLNQVRDEQRTWSLQQWLNYLESIHSKIIDMGLDRVNQVLARLELDFAGSQVITVAGTNGKGTTCVMLEQTALLLDKTVGVYSSPHLLDYRERVRINGKMLSEKQHCEAFLAIEQARQGTSLTYFEFGTLAGLYLLARAQVQVVLLEVGLGGRLDAINVIDPDVAVITGIALDHQDWLGDTREAIAVEKAGILRPGIKAVVGDPEPPATLRSAVEAQQSNALFQHADFRNALISDSGWQWECGDVVLENLPLPCIPIQNASTAIAVMLQAGWPLSSSVISKGLKLATLPGRYQVIANAPRTLVDVAHNPQAISHLLEKIKAEQYQKLHLVVAMLADKDIKGGLEPFNDLTAEWYVASLGVPRGAKSSTLASCLAGNAKVSEFETVNQAFEQAKCNASEGDLIVVFGSFFTVAAVLQGEG